MKINIQFWRWYRVLVVIFAILGIALMYISGSTASYGINFFSYFTVQSNIIAIFVLLGYVFFYSKRSIKQWDYLRGAMMVYLLTTAITYIILFEKNTVYHSLLEAWGDILVHKVVPLLSLVDFIFHPFIKRISWQKFFGWISFPLLWLIYTFIRGIIVNWYPYYFLNPHKEAGIPGVLSYSLGISFGVCVLCVIVGSIGNRFKF